MNRMSALMFVVAFLLTTFALRTVAGEQERSQPFIVSTKWLAAHLKDPDLILLHVGEKPQYDTAHIPGAQFISRDQISTPRGQGLTLELPSVAHLDSVFESMGISNNSKIILYFGKDWTSPTSRVFFTLDYIGLGNRTSYLDGGMPVWIEDGNSVTREIIAPKMGTIKRLRIDNVAVNLDWMKSNLESPHVKIIDARTRNYYTGKDTGYGMRPGHIPSARSLPFVDLTNANGTFKSTDELKVMFQAQDIKADDEVVSYCHIGQQATLVYFVARSLGYRAKVYDGSFEEWGRQQDLPVV
ncbi:MAG: sulfurtransferase, partial [bacterium]